MFSFRIRILLFISLILGGCSSSNSEEYRHIEFASCSWQIPASYEAIREITDDDFRFREKLVSWDYGTNPALMVFSRGNSTRESFEVFKDVHRDFRISETEDFLLVQYRIISSESKDPLNDKGRSITALAEKKTGHSVTLAALEIGAIVSGCEIPNGKELSGTTTPELKVPE